jgi:hypothetical protein
MGECGAVEGGLIAAHLSPQRSLQRRSYASFRVVFLLLGSLAVSQDPG